MKSLHAILIIGSLALSGVCFAQSPPPAPTAAPEGYTERLAAYNALPAAAPYDTKLSAVNGVIASATTTGTQAKSYALRAILQKGAKKYAEEAESWRLSVELGNDSMLSAYIGALFNGGKVAEATAAANAYVTAHPESPQGYAAQAALLYVQNQFQPAADKYALAFNKASADDSPSRWWMLVNRAKSLQRLGKTPAEVNAVIIPAMTEKNVKIATAPFQEAFGMVSRKAMSKPERKTFFQSLLTLVDVSADNAPFLGLLKSQDAAEGN